MKPHLALVRGESKALLSVGAAALRLPALLLLVLAVVAQAEVFSYTTKSEWFDDTGYPEIAGNSCCAFAIVLPGACRLDPGE